MSLAAGTRLGAYEILALLGRGGMGEVYRARDTRLKRDVALKVLPTGESHDRESLARFQREAELLATLNHPNIAAIYGLEESTLSGVSTQPVGAIVMELVEGETLADRLARGALDVDEAMRVGRQIVDALEAAHERGVIHRDLKPANVKLTPDGHVKVLDFGLAKLLDPGGSARGAAAAVVSNSPTMLTGASLPGMILGTAAYMAPEQARGRGADKRADIWAFGCVLFEMLANERAFDGEDVTEILGAVIHNEPRWSALPDGIPRTVRRIVTRCLQKDPKQRFRDIGDVRIELDESARTPADSLPATSSPRPPAVRSTIGWLLALIFAAVAAGIGFRHFRESPPRPPEVMQFQILPPPGVTFVSNPVISPDGRKISVGARDAEGRSLLWIRSIDSLEARPLAGTDRVFGAAVPGGQASFWSPDSRFVAFVADGKLKKVQGSGGPATTIATLPVANTTAFRGGTWGRDDDIVFGIQGSGLWRVSASGGTPSPLTTLREGESLHAVPVFLPDGRHLLYSRRLAEGVEAGIHVGSLDLKPEQQPTTPLLVSRSGAVYAPSPVPDKGYVLFTRDTTLVAQSFDVTALALVGDAVAVAEDLGTQASPAFSASSSGTLVYRTVAGTDSSRLTWFDRKGTPGGQVGGQTEWGDVFLSPDGKMIVVRQTDPQTRTPHLWTADLSRGVLSRLNPGSSFDVAPAVSADRRVAFSSNIGGALGDIFVRSASGAGDAELIVKSPIQKHPNHWSHDNRFLIYDEHHPTQQQDLWIVPMIGDRKPMPFVTTRADETQGQFSPDGKWIAYRSDESGRPEIYVRDFVPDRVPAAGSGKWQISTAGGSSPRWRPDGKELYYLAPDRKMMAVPVKTAPVFEPGTPLTLFALPTVVVGFFPYDVAPDGRFLIDVAADAAAASSSPITVVVNWMEQIKKK